MTNNANAFKGKAILLLSGGASVANWLLDRGSKVAVTEAALVRRLQAHSRAIAKDGEEYERRKKNIKHMSDDQVKNFDESFDLIVASSALMQSHPAILRAHEEGVAVTEPSHINGATAIPSRQRILYKSDTLTVVDDSGSWLPARSVYSVNQWGGPNCILISGGAGSSDFSSWSDMVKKKINKNNLVLINGDATLKMRKAFGSHGRGVRIYDSMEEAWAVAARRAGQFVSSVILFSPAAKSFDGEKFNQLVKEELS